MIDHKGGKCQFCGYSKCVRSLHFHHIDSRTKEAGLGQITHRQWDRVLKELDKCILVCANCHGEIHDGLVELSK
jgi:hypothetical protein